MKIHCLLLVLCVSAIALGSTLSDKRDSLVNGERDFARLQATIDSETDPILRRTALRLLGDCGQEAVPFLNGIVRGDEDPQMRYNALLVLWQLCGEDVDPELLVECLHSSETNVCVVAASIYFSKRPLPPERLQLAQQILKTAGDSQLRAILSQVTWPFHRNVQLLKNRPDWDHEVTLIQDHTLPMDGWAFCLDPDANMHLNEECYKEEFDDSSWARISIGKPWEDFGYDYDGIAWYRTTFDVPPKPEEFNAVELHFDSVDESAWVWLNGRYVGVHNIGPTGWNVPFSLDVTDLVRWGEPNQIAVRVQDVSHAGGIYRPVHLQIMK